jgi:hypothetical protein
MLDTSAPATSSAPACLHMLAWAHVQAAAVRAARPVVHVDDVQRRQRRRRVLLVARHGAAGRAAAAPRGLAVGPQAAAQRGVVGRACRRGPVRAARRLSRHLTNVGTGPHVRLQDTAKELLNTSTLPAGHAQTSTEAMPRGVPDKTDAFVRQRASRMCTLRREAAKLDARRVGLVASGRSGGVVREAPGVRASLACSTLRRTACAMKDSASPSPSSHGLPVRQADILLYCYEM